MECTDVRSLQVDKDRKYIFGTYSCMCMHACSKSFRDTGIALNGYSYNIHFYQYGINLAMCDSTLFGGLV